MNFLSKFLFPLLVANLVHLAHADDLQAIQECNGSTCSDLSKQEYPRVKRELELVLSSATNRSQIKVCATESIGAACNSDRISFVNFAAFLIPGPATFSKFFEQETVGKEKLYGVQMSYMGGAANCKKTSLVVQQDEKSILLTTPSFYCNWLVVGNVGVEIKFFLRRFNYAKNELDVDYSIKMIGTSIGGGSGTARLILDDYQWPSRITDVVGNSQISSGAIAIGSSLLDDPNRINSLPEITHTSNLKFENRKALVIGNDTYKSIPKLLAAREDARTIASNLTAVGYQVTLKLDLTEKEIKAALRNFAAQVQGGDEVMFFFAGHGVQLGAANYLLPTDIVGDSEAQVRDEAIQLQRVLDDMSEKKAKFTLAMIDACRDNPFKTTGRAIGGRGLAPTTAATGQMVIFSAGTGQQALDRLGNSDRNKNGLFTRVFVQEMQKPNVSIDRVVKNVRNQVAELAKSVGHEQVPAIYDQVLGDFYFK
jgi:hypothetical protein